ncbi:uncharacterized protein LOC142530561 [Primulina tabacum]|uniref:uncharacterized protein LOC142530561 n=1 Tax=Primulina tabacum TaxID=48773 RepID=UPI003F5A07D4
MPPRRDPSVDRQDEIPGGGRGPPPPPPLDAATRVLEGMTRLLEQVQQASRPQVNVFEKFRRLNPKEFGGTTYPFLTEGWIRSLELHFEYLKNKISGNTDGDRARCSIYVLRDDASLWWEGAAHAVDLSTLTWDGFKELFYGKSYPVDFRGRLTREFMSLCQGDTSVAEFIRKFDRGCHFVPMIARDAAQKLRHFLDGLRPTLRRDLMLMRPAGYDEATAYAFQSEEALRDIDFEMQRKRHQTQSSSQFQKKQLSGPSRQHKPKVILGGLSSRDLLKRQGCLSQLTGSHAHTAISSMSASVCGVPKDASFAGRKDSFPDALRALRVYGDAFLSDERARDLNESQESRVSAILGLSGIEVDPSKVEAVIDWPLPKSVTDIRSSLGLAGYYIKFIQGFSSIVVPMTALTKNNAKFIWDLSVRRALID